MKLFAEVSVPQGPVPTQFDIATAANGANRWVVFQIATPSGVQTYYFPEEAAKKIANAILERIGGIVLASPGDAPK